MANRIRKVVREDAKSTTRTPSARSTVGMERQVLAFAKQAGYVAGTIQMKTEGWMDRQTLGKQIASVRDGATRLLEQLGRATGTTGKRKVAARPTRKAARARSGGAVDAPGKTHRKRQPADPDARLARSQASKLRAVMPTEKTHRHRNRG